MTTKEIYEQGFRDGLKTFAWWKDGIEEVGTTGTTLKKAQRNLEELWNYNPPKEKHDIIE